MIRCLCCYAVEKVLKDGRRVIVHMRTCPDYLRPGHLTERRS